MKLPGNMQSMMKQAQQMQQRMQEEIALIEKKAGYLKDMLGRL